MDARQQRIQSDNERVRARKFWNDHNSWPFDAPEYVFIPRALDALGRSLFAGEWPPDILDIRKSPRITDVVLTLREHFAFGRLIGAIQRHNGTFEPLPAEIWNTRDYEQWFNTDFKAPSTATGRHGHPLAAVSECWLFVERAGFEALDTFVTGGMNKLGDDGVHQSAYVRFLLCAVKQLNVQPDDTRTAKEIANKIEDLAKRLDADFVSRTMAENMATILREPEAGKGKASVNRRKKT